jgi:hypothetical protein
MVLHPYDQREVDSEMNQTWKNVVNLFKFINNLFLRSWSSQHIKLVYDISLFVGQGTLFRPTI